MIHCLLACQQEQSVIICNASNERRMGVRGQDVVEEVVEEVVIVLARCYSAHKWC